MLPRRPIAATLVFTAALLSGCAAHPGIASAPPSPSPSLRAAQVGSASYLADSLAGRRTASGRRFDPARLVAAHRTLPFGTRIRITNLENGRRVVLTVVDRGPFRAGRIVDVSSRAARELGFYRAGLARVRLEVVSGPDEASADDAR